jgi:DNA-binding PucR family transcriptional regulator
VTWQGALTGLYPDSEPELTRHRSAWTEVLHTLGAYGPLTVTVGTAVSGSGDFTRQHRMLGEIAKIQQSRSRYFNVPQVAMLDDLGPLADVIEATPGRGFAPFVERVLRDLLDDTRFGGRLIETLYAYLQTGGSPQEAGALLHLHPSTVKYRMRVIRERLGPQLADPGSRLDIELAVRLCLAAGLPDPSPAC